MQDLVNAGHFPPHDAFWLKQNIPRWSQALAIESHQTRTAAHRFVVDPDSDAGLARLKPESAGTCLGFDPASFLDSIRAEIALLRADAGGSGEGSAMGRGRQVKLLRKLDELCAPERPVIARRGERESTALAVEVAVGMWQIMRALRDKPDDVAGAASRSNSALGGHVGAGSVGGSTITQWSANAPGAPRSRLTMVDRSDSGCRLHGPALAGNPLMPGVLIAFRPDAASPWMLAIVRRVKKRLAGKRVEVGVEYLGNDPRRIIVVVPDSETTPARPPGSAPQRFGALFLPESTRHPVLPFKSMVMPARGLAPEDRLSVRSRTDLYTIQLKEPLEEQADFVWSPFEILDRRLKDEGSEPRREPESYPASVEAMRRAQ